MTLVFTADDVTKTKKNVVSLCKLDRANNLAMLLKQKLLCYIWLCLTHFHSGARIDFVKPLPSEEVITFYYLSCSLEMFLTSDSIYSI